MSELSPGSVSRRWLPKGGERAYRDKVHREGKFADEHKNLPFELSKPSRRVGHGWFACAECGRVLLASKNTVMCVCLDCKKLTKVEVLD